MAQARRQFRSRRAQIVCRLGEQVREGESLHATTTIDITGTGCCDARSSWGGGGVFGLYDGAIWESGVGEGLVSLKRVRGVASPEMEVPDVASSVGSPEMDLSGLGPQMSEVGEEHGGLGGCQ